MRSPARSLSASRSSDAAIIARERAASFSVSPDERIGPHLGRRRGRTVWRGIAVLALLGMAWAQLDGRVDALGWLSTITTTVTSTLAPLFERGPDRTAEPAKPVLTPIVAAAGTEPTARSAKVALDESVSPPQATQAPSVVNAAAVPLVAPAPPTEIATNYAPPAPPPADLYQVRSKAAGLHSDLSRVLLARLSADDFRNAKAAIDTAVAETADDDALVWPRQRKAEQALFKVHFVPGAAPDCRRYVVTIAKDGWSTTALPMERCGVTRKAAQRK